MSAPLKDGTERPFINDPRLARFREVMEERKLTKMKLSQKSEISYAHLNKVLNGVMELNPTLLEKIALKGLNLPPSFFEEVTIESSQKPKTRKDAQLMSEIVDGAEEILRYVEGMNVDGLSKFFNDEPTRPLIATGHGGRYSQAVYAALLYSTNQGLGRAVTCYSCNSLSDATIRNSKILLCSRGMTNIDIDYIANRCIDLNPDFTCAMRISTDKEVDRKYQNTVKKLNGLRYSFVFDLGINLPESFIAISSVFFYSAVLYKSFSGDSDFVSKLELNKDPLANYSYASADGLAAVPTLDKINRFTVLYGSYGETVAYNIESNIVEGGIGTCMISDYKNYTYGRFLAEGNYIKSAEHPLTEAALICLVTPREANIYEDLISVMPPHLPIITIRTDLITPLATIDLLYKANRFVAYLGEHFFHTNPNHPNNFCGIDKRVPKNGVDFKPDFKIYGALDIDTEKTVIEKLCKELKIKADNLQDLFKIRDSILKNEQWRTCKAEVNWKKAKPLTWDDFSFGEVHEYDTEKQQCWSFNSKNDVREGISLQLGNMANGYGVKILGVQFPNSEIPYQLARFNDEQSSIRLQEEIVDPFKGWLYNGMKMKRKFIYSQQYWMNRRDTEFERGKGLWRYEWMKWIIWEKVKQNKGFRDILLALPKNAIIIEQAQRRPTKKPSIWGAWNEELLAERKIVIRTAQIENGLCKTSRMVRDEIYKVNNVGIWVGENAMGQILTMCKLALIEGINIPIDEVMLNDAKINWFGKLLYFSKDSDGAVTVKAIAKPRRSFPEPTNAQEQTSGETATRRGKRAVSVRKSAFSFEADRKKE